MLETLIVFGIAILLWAAFPARAAYNAGGFYSTDLALLLAPIPAFLLTLFWLNPAAQVGLAPIVYPFLVLAAGATVFCFRVFVLAKLRFNQKAVSACTLVVVLCAAAAFGAMVAPWYE